MPHRTVKEIVEKHLAKPPSKLGSKEAKELVQKQKNDFLKKVFGKKGVAKQDVEVGLYKGLLNFVLYPEDFKSLFKKTAYEKFMPMEDVNDSTPQLKGFTIPDEVAGFIPHPKHIMIPDLKNKIMIIRQASAISPTLDHEKKHIDQIKSRIDSQKALLRAMNKFRRGKMKYESVEHCLKRILNDELGAYVRGGTSSARVVKILAYTSKAWLKYIHEGTDTPKELVDRRIKNLRKNARDTAVYAFNNLQYGWTSKEKLEKMTDTMRWDELVPILRKMRPEENR